MRWPEPVRRSTLEAAYRLGGWPRRVAAVLCHVAAIWSLVQDRRDPGAVTARVVVATRDLGAGTILGDADIRMERWPTPIVPPAALRSADRAVGATVGAAVNRGEPITDARLRGRGVTTGLPAAWVAITVVSDNAAAAALIRAGDRVDVLAATSVDPMVIGRSTVPPARLVATDVRVLAVMSPGADQTGTQPTSVVLGADRSTALHLASFGASPLTITLRGS